MILLSNITRLRSYVVGKTQGDPIGSTGQSGVQNTRMLTNLLSSASQQIEYALNRRFEITSRTEYFDIRQGIKQFWLLGVPVSSITTVKEDSDGQFTGNESTLTAGSEYFVGPDANSVVLDVARSWEKERGLQVIYEGGLAYSGTQSIFNITGLTNTPTAGNVVIGGTSGAVATVVSYDATNSRITVDSYYGIFIEGETLTEYNNDVDQTASGFSCTYATANRQSLAETHPKLVTACEMQVRYNWEHATNFEDSAQTKDGTNFGFDIRTDITLRPEVINMIKDYRLNMV
jgi:hypothetical protein